MSRPTRIATRIACGLLTLAGPAVAGEGVREINQACAQGPGCFPGDTPGFWITISSPGTYRLTSDLLAPLETEAIRIEANDVTLDLNGFTIASAGGAILRNGVFVIDRRNVEIRNGTVRGFSGRGVMVQQSLADASGARVIDVRALQNGVIGIDTDGPGALVRGCTANENGLWGISVVESSLVLDSVAISNTSFGLQLHATAGYGSNLLGNNNGGNANAQVSGGIQLGTNVCGTDTVCP
jgi:hypothetical protein